MRIPQHVKETLEAAQKERRLVVATSSKSAVPNAAPIGILKIVNDETLLIVDNYFLKTRQNLEENPHVSISAWHMEEKEGSLSTKAAYQLKGRAKIVSSGELYERVRTEIKSKRPELPVKAIVLIKVEEIYDSKSGPNAGKPITPS
ncbi:MAG: pyridoxamine 5'-phosphate oxidase family protein [Candidatus Methanomethylicaceae archaeon]